MTELVKCISRGNNVLEKLSELRGKTLVVSMDIPWKGVQKYISWEPTEIIWAQEMGLNIIENLEKKLADFDWVVGIGGGVSCDLAKYIAWKRNIPLVLVPTIVSVDAPFTPSIAIREDNVVRYIGNIIPNHIFVDYRIIQDAPPHLNRAGVADLLSIHTALWDWKCSAENNNEKYDAQIAHEAEECLIEIDKMAEEIYNVTPQGIDTIVNLYCKEVELCNTFGNARPEEGSEHIVAYHVEYLTKRQFLHGDLVGMGIFCMSRLQENKVEWITNLLKRCGVKFQVDGLSKDEILQTLLGLKKFKDDTGLFYSVIDVKTITNEFANNILNELNLI
ncbi:MAG: iron-containing alcohol dehydrogenase [Candidatus Hydrogenedens sp.]